MLTKLFPKFPELKYRVEVPEGTIGHVTVSKFCVDADGYVQENGRKVRAVSFQDEMRGWSIPEGTYTRMLRDGRCWMSDTPSEVRTHFTAIFAIEKVGGRILINGLGLGLIVKAALSCPNVTSVDVVEIDPDVAALVAPTYAKDPRFHLHIGDAMAMKWPRGTKWDYAWHDIWLDICADNLPEMHRLHRMYGKRVKAQNSWGRALLD